MTSAFKTNAFSVFTMNTSLPGCPQDDSSFKKVLSRLSFMSPSQVFSLARCIHRTQVIELWEFLRNMDEIGILAQGNQEICLIKFKKYHQELGYVHEKIFGKIYRLQIGNLNLIYQYSLLIASMEKNKRVTCQGPLKVKNSAFLNYFQSIAHFCFTILQAAVSHVGF